MAKAAVGDRVGVLISANEGVVKFLGYGVRVEDKVPPSNAAGFGSELHKYGVKNICLKLDSGKEAFGCESWWGPENEIKQRFTGWTFEQVDIDEFRAEIATRREPK